MKSALATLASIAVLACAGEPSSGQTDGSFPFGEVAASCAPWDGAAVSLILTRDAGGAGTESYPRISIMVYRGLPDVLGQSFSFEAGSQEVGGSSFCSAADGCESVPNTTVRFGALHGDFWVLTQQ